MLKTVRRGLSAVFVCSCVAGPLIAEIPQYGVNAHLHGDEYPWYKRSLSTIAPSGVQVVRCDLGWKICQNQRGSDLDFSRFDAVLAEAERQNVMLAPIFGHPPSWALPLERHLDEWIAFVDASARRYRGRIKSWEVLNEVNCKPNDSGLGKYAVYAELLRQTYRTIKRADPEALVSAAGTAGIDMQWAEGILQAGAGESFDVFSVHPYTRPFPPEGLDVRIGALRTLLDKYGAGDRAIWVNEMGWPTHRTSFDPHAAEMLDLAFRETYPTRKKWRIAYADNCSEDAPKDDTVANAVQTCLPEGCTVESVSPGNLARRLPKGDFDLVLMPVSEEYSPRSVRPIMEFLKKGGVLVETGGMPMYHARERDASGTYRTVEGADPSADRRLLRIHDVAWWIDSDYPRSAKCVPTDYARAHAFKCDPAGFGSRLFVSDRNLAAGDEFHPLIEGKTISGKPAAVAALIKFNSDWHGYVLVSAKESTTTAMLGDRERLQAQYHARALGISMACGVGLYAPYELRGGEEVPYYTEAHYGLLHWNWAPKPAWSAYLTFVDCRPNGSVNIESEAWKSEDGKSYSPCWRRPDGLIGGMFWTTGTTCTKDLRLPCESAVFVDFLGERVFPRKLDKGTYKLTVSGEPLYFVEVRER